MLSNTVEYALRAMMHLAALGEGGAATCESIAAATQVPQGYLSKVLRDLVVASLVLSQRGPNGGFSLARAPGSITMLDVVNAVDPITRIRRCPIGNPAHMNLCPLHRRIDNALALIERQFNETTLAEILETKDTTGSQCRALVTPARNGKKSRSGA